MKEEEKLPEYRWTWCLGLLRLNPRSCTWKSLHMTQCWFCLSGWGALRWLRCSQESDPSTVLSLPALFMAHCCCSGITASPFLTAQGWFDARYDSKQPLRALWWLRMRAKHVHSRFLLSDSYSEVLLWGRFWERQTRLWRYCRMGLKSWRLRVK